MQRCKEAENNSPWNKGRDKNSWPLLTLPLSTFSWQKMPTTIWYGQGWICHNELALLGMGDGGDYAHLLSGYAFHLWCP